MTTDKRQILCWVLILAWVMAIPYVMRLTGFDMGPKKPAVDAAKIAAAKAKDKAIRPDPVTAKDTSARTPTVKSVDGKVNEVAKIPPEKGETGDAGKPRVELLTVQPVMGSVADQSPTGYRLEVRLIQKGAGIESASSSRYNAEFEYGQRRKSPLQLIGATRGRVRRSPDWPPSLAMTLNLASAGAKPALNLQENEEEQLARQSAERAEDFLDSVVWEAVRDEHGNVVRPVTKTDPASRGEVTGQAVVFRTKAENGVIVTKTFRLFPNTDGLEVSLRFESPEKEQTVTYNLLGPHGIPIEGEWYTGTFRDVVFGQLEGNETKPITTAASEVATATKLIDNTALPLVFAGVENQYFATLIEQDQKPKRDEDRLESKTVALLLHKDELAPQKSDVGVRLTSRPVKVGPNLPVEHTYRIFAGPKTADALEPYHAEILATYRKGGWFSIPFAPYLARYVITPALGITYGLTLRVSRLLGGNTGNYGVAIILLTICVRGIMFPLGRKQALSAQKMQLLQPQLKELQEKYKEDKERLTKETFALYKKQGVNPVGGCLPALIQLPIFVGLWQALNTSFKLRHATFLWIRDLSAPDMMFHLPFEIPYLGNWFNLLPFVVVALMLVQTKLFAPPATTPEAEAQQKTMKLMMIVMGAMFYKVPSGLGLYFITSSSWAICERLLLPKLAHTHLTGDAGRPEDSGDTGKGPGSRASVKGGSGGVIAPAKPPGRLARFWERVLDEARKDSTYRKMTEGRDEKGNDEHGRDPERPRPRPKPRKR